MRARRSAGVEAMEEKSNQRWIGRAALDSANVPALHAGTSRKDPPIALGYHLCAVQTRVGPQYAAH